MVEESESTEAKGGAHMNQAEITVVVVFRYREEEKHLRSSGGTRLIV
jgi:hypothetical protein